MKSLYDQHILTNGRNLQIPINHGLPDQQLGFTFCRLRYENVRRARKSGWGDDYPQADYNFMVRLKLHGASQRADPHDEPACIAPLQRAACLGCADT